jgi:hypothetical protein
MENDIEALVERADGDFSVDGAHDAEGRVIFTKRK